VIAIGPGNRDKVGNLISIPVQIGDHIILSGYRFDEITHEDQEYVVLNADDIIALIEQ
jgi:chaperonin GroES